MKNLRISARTLLISLVALTGFSQGDKTIDVDTSGRDEVAEMARAVQVASRPWSQLLRRLHHKPSLCLLIFLPLHRLMAVAAQSRS